MKKGVSIVIADDHLIFRQGLKQMIETDAALKVVAEVGDGASALAAIERAFPHHSHPRRQLKLLAQYKTSQEIADELCISVRTVHHRRSNITLKTVTSDR